MLFIGNKKKMPEQLFTKGFAFCMVELGPEQTARILSNLLLLCASKADKEITHINEGMGNVIATPKKYLK